MSDGPSAPAANHVPSSTESDPQPSGLTASRRSGGTGRRVLLNTGSLAGSSLWRIFISFVLQVLITRMLGVAAFGQYVSALAFLNLAQVVSELGLGTLLVRDLAPAADRRRAYFFAALRIQAITAFATWGGLILLTLVLPLSPETRRALQLVGASLPFFAVTSVSQTLFKAAERMELVMGVEGAVNTLILLTSIGVLTAGGDVAALMGVMVLTQAFSALLCLWLIHRTGLLAPPQESVSVGFGSLWRRTRPFYWLALTDVLLHRMDILLLNLVAGDYVIGVYGIAYSVVRVLIKLIQSYWLALYPTLSRLWHQSTRQYALLSSLGLRYGLMLVLPAAAAGTGIADEILGLLYRENGADSVLVFQTLVWVAPLFLIELYAITQLLVEFRTRFSLWITWLHIGAVVLLLPPLTLALGAEGAALAMVAASALGTLAAVLIARRFQVPLSIPRGWALLVATLAAAAVSLWLPAPWLVRGGAAGLVFLLIIVVTGSISRDDRRLLRRLLQGDPIGAQAETPVESPVESPPESPPVRQ